jgi:hypothetical protein
LLLGAESAGLAPAEPKTRKMMPVPNMHSLPVSADAGAFRREEHRLCARRCSASAHDSGEVEVRDLHLLKARAPFFFRDRYSLRGTRAMRSP